jgi:hypothetical protein
MAKRRADNQIANLIPTTLNRESQWFPCVKVACHISWKALNEGYKFAVDLISIGGLHTKLWASKVARVSISRISKLQLRSPETKWRLGVGPSWLGVRWLSILLFSILWGDYTWKYICYRWKKKNGKCISRC